ncbi:SGNH/GDSL hydrolase family protein [Desulfosporosinus fructosivorans]
MRITAKTELYIITFALILASLVIGVFWALNRGDKPEYTLEQASPISVAKPVTTETSAGSSKSEQATAAPVLPRGLTRLRESTTVNALILGDSIAESNGASNKDLLGWSTLVSSDLHRKYPGNIQWYFKTSAGASINDVLTFVPIATQDTDLIVLCLGRQDVGKLRLTEFKQKYEQLLVELKAKSPQADLFLVVEPPVKDTTENNRFFPYRKIILDLGLKHQLPVIDVWTAFINDPTPLSELLADGVNPNDKGYEVFAAEVLKRFDSYLLSAY